MGGRSDNVTWHAGEVSPQRRSAATGGPGATVWMTGLPASGKSTIAIAVEQALLDRRRAAYLLDGDNLRHGLNGNLGFSAEDRAENVRRVAEVSRLLADAGVVALVSVVSPYAADRARARELHAHHRLAFAEVFVDTPLEECERRDPKGLYARARAGELTGMTGVDDPYERPQRPDLALRPLEQSVEQSAAAVLALVEGLDVRPEAERSPQTAGQDAPRPDVRPEAEPRSQSAGPEAPRPDVRPEAEPRSQSAGPEAPRPDVRPEAEPRSQSAGPEAPRR